MKRTAGDLLVLTCEHGGNRVPAEYTPLFRGAGAVLASHRGWDPGALTLARLLSRKLRRPLHAVTWSRLFVEANRAPSNRRIWSSFTAPLPRAERLRILDRWWRPHREAVEAAVADAVGKGHRVVHVAVHSFTPELDGEVRNCDLSFLYDSRRKPERAWCRRWAAALHELDPRLRIRHNYPYQGNSDGMTTWLRKRHAASRYLGIELEVNQAMVGGAAWRQLQAHLAQSLRALLAGDEPR
ncbi:MAG TPA: N-formylglutamate amidohydrolase [Planctomycetota bacterium]|nr:N-formylglutamate amidohydrolase [Planctomycetota bacterium]